MLTTLLLFNSCSEFAGEAMIELHDGQQFSTRDKDNDESATGSCSRAYGYGGNWFYGVKYCFFMNLNAQYLEMNDPWCRFVWNPFKTATRCKNGLTRRSRLKRTKMMIRPKK